MRVIGHEGDETAMTAEGLRLAVFGGPRVWRDGAELDLGPPQRRMLLTLLMLAGGDAVSTDLVVETLWEDNPPETALNVVHRHVGQLRRTLEPELTSRQPGTYVAAAGNGYRLAVSAENLDLLELRMLLSGDRDRGAVGRALALAAGRAGAGVATTPTMGSLLAPIEADRVAAGLAGGELADALHDVQEARRLLPAIQAIAHDHPFDEPLQAALTRTLVAAGRRADALAHFGAVRALMDAELGLEPGPELQAAQQVALLEPEAQRDETSDDVRPVIEAGVHRPAQLPVHAVRIVGRATELADVVGRLREPTTGSAVCCLTGMGGIGKTTLARQCAQEVLDTYPDGQLYVNLHGYDSEVAPTSPVDALRSFLVALGVSPMELPTGLDDRAALYRSLVSDQRLLVVVDNAHDSAHVRPLLPGGRGCGVLITSRRRLDELVAEGATAFALDRLAHAEGVELLRTRIGAARVESEPEAADAVVEACQGLPLALSILSAQVARYRDVTLAELVDQLGEPSGTLEMLSGGATATDLRRVLSWSYDALSEPAAHLFRCTGVHPGPGLSLLAAVSLAGVDVAGARRTLDELARANLVVEVAPSRFHAHQLLRAYAYELLTQDEAITTRRRLLGHYLGTVRNAYLLHGRPALTALPESVDGVTPETFGSLGEAHAWYLRERQALAVLVVQAATAGLAVESACLVIDARPLAQHHSPAGDLLPLTRAALDALETTGGPAVLRAELRRDLGLLLCRTGQRDRGRNELVRALAEFEAIDDAGGRSSTLRNLARVARFDGDLDAAMLYARDSVDIARRELDEANEAVQLTILAEALTAAGRTDEAVTVGERSVELTRAHRMAAWEPHALESLAFACASGGDYAGALAHITEAHEIQRRHGLGTGSSLTETRHHLYLAEFHYGAGDHEAALASYRHYLERADAFGPLTPSVAVIDPTEAALGDPDRVRGRIVELGG